MITLTKLDGTEFVLNCDLIETIHMAPDTIIKLVNEKIIIVKEPMEEIINRIIAFRKQIFSQSLKDPNIKKESNK